VFSSMTPLLQAHSRMVVIGVMVLICVVLMQSVDAGRYGGWR
jgi:ABC-type cobalt transport system substrate-binding protein